MSRVLERTARQLFSGLMLCFRETRPGREFGNYLFLGVIYLGLLANKAGQTQDLQERRRMINEFYQGKKTIEKGIRLLRKDAETKAKDAQGNLRRTMP